MRWVGKKLLLHRRERPSAPFPPGHGPGRCAEGSVSNPSTQTSLGESSSGHGLGRCADGLVHKPQLVFKGIIESNAITFDAQGVARAAADEEVPEI